MLRYSANNITNPKILTKNTVFIKIQLKRQDKSKGNKEHTVIVKNDVQCTDNTINVLQSVEVIHALCIKDEYFINPTFACLSYRLKIFISTVQSFDFHFNKCAYWIFLTIVQVVNIVNIY